MVSIVNMKCGWSWQRCDYFYVSTL